MKVSHIILVILLALGAGYAGAKLTPAATTDTKIETAYERVMRTGVLRCGYVEWPPYTSKNISTGKFEGLYVDLVEAYMSALNIKVEWAYEIGVGQQIEAFKTGRIDAGCLDGPWVATLAKYVTYAKPSFFMANYLYQKADATPLDIKALNKKDVRFSMMDGDTSQELVNNLFPEAGRLEIPAVADPALLLENVKTNKADIVVSDNLSVQKYEKTHGLTFRKMSPEPLAIYGCGFSTQAGQHDLLNLLNQSVDLTRRNGIEDRIIARYNALYPEAIVRTAQEYR